MKRIVIIISIVLFVLTAGAEGYLQSDAFSRMIRPYVLGPLKELVGDDAKIGLVKAHFIPPNIEVRDISIPYAGGNEAIAIRKIKAYINPLPLFLKKIRLPSISILEPRIYAERAKDGTINLTPLIDRIRTNAARKESEGTAGFSLLLRNLSLSKGRIEYKDKMTSAQYTLSDLNVTTRVYLSQDRFTTSIKSGLIRISTPVYPEIMGKVMATMKYDRGRIHMDTAELSTTDAVFTVSGDAGLSQESPLDLKITGRSGPQTIGRFLDVLKPVKKQKDSLFEVQALVRGKLSDPVVEGNLKISAIPVREYVLRNGALSFSYRDKSVTISGSQWKLTKGGANLVIDSIDAALGASREGLEIRRLDILAGDLALHGDGRADTAKGFDALLSAASSGKGRTISILTGLPFEGPVKVTGRLSGKLDSPRFDGSLSAGPVTVRGVLISSIAGRIEYEHKKILLSSVDIAEQSSRYIFSGSVDLNGKEPVYSARLRVLRSNVVNVVAMFYKQLPLVLSATGELTFSGTAQNYSGNGHLTLDAGSAYGESFVRGAVTASLTNGRIAFPQVVLYKERGMVKATGWIGFHDGKYSADLESRGIDLSEVDRLKDLPIAGEGNLDIHSSGTFTLPVVRASLTVEALSYHQVSMGGIHAIAFIRDGVIFCKTGLPGDRVNLTMRWTLHTPYPWTADVKILTDDFDPLSMLDKKGLADRVKVAAEGVLRAQGRGLDLSTISGEAIFKKLRLFIGDYRIDNDSEVKLSVEGSKISVKALNFVGADTRFGITGWVRPMEEIDIALKGTANLSLLKLLYREVEHAAGVAEVKFGIKDTWKNPDITGELLLRNGEIKIKDIPQRFTALNSKIVFEQGRIVADSLSGEVGGGTLSASGWAQLSGLQLQDFSAKASVDNVTVRYPEGLTSTLSGELYYDGDASEQSLAGDITIIRSRYDKRVEWKSMLVDIGRGLYQKKKTEVAWIGDTQVNIRFHGENNILFQNNLAKMPLAVDVFLRGTVNHPQLLGRIEARSGVVYFRKNEFKILRASVDFVDPNRMNPVLDIQAETQVREYKIRLAVTGTAEHAVITYISEPSLIDTDILALLTLGKTGSELKGKETGVGVGEATSFATGQFQDVIERNAKRLTGLDRFQVDPYVGKSDTSVPRVTVGKELVRNKLYATYSSNVGATAPEQLFRMEYLLNRHFSVVGERNETGNNGADIKYRFEFK
ncbi:MAG: translocation/assembly module TamB domain-containing protein [Nitrospirae bacterium]|nr:translocation/assembly module TamB domain-containing protein [Nitrospirota bacterium]